ncbi:hypothetical protein RB595_006222 [Gaeumannomyces hyphopodioides]
MNRTPAEDTPSADETASQGASTPSLPPAKAGAKSSAKTKPTACRRCHSRKVRCSGGQPCQNCRQAGKTSDCTYPRRNRLVKVSQRYLDDLIAENERLRAARSGDDGPPPNTPAAPRQDAREVSCVGGQHAISLDDRPWFFDLNIPNTPILLGEASDAAFATRFRQAVAGGRHIPRVNYATDEDLLALSDTDCEWPSPSRARFLVDVALRCASRHYHIVRRSKILEGLEQTLANPTRSSDSLLRCKLWALFALGEMYSARSADAAENCFPGIHYFARATRIMRIVSERPRIGAIEIRLLLSFYSLAINRRHTAYTLAGSAVRLAVVMGLHVNVPPCQLTDVAAREHRCRVWWTAYTFDRLWAAKLGNPVAIEDNEIRVDFPSEQPALEGTVDAGDFADAGYCLARIKLARVAGKITQSIYGRRIHQESLSHRVQEALSDLRAWADELPSHLHLDYCGSGSSEAVPKPLPLHLSFNQCLVTATRPILLHVLRTHVASWPPRETDDRPPEPRDPAPPIPAVAMTVADACIRSARHSVQLLKEAWIDGSFATFNYFYSQYMFSAATVMAVSSLLPSGADNGSDGEHFEAAASILNQVKNNGSFAGREFCRHMDAIKTAIAEARLRKAGAPSGSTSPRVGTNTAGGIATVPRGQHNTSRAALAADTSSLLGAPAATAGAGMGAGPAQQQLWTTQNGITGTALLESSLHQLLAQPALDLQFIDSSIYGDGSYSQGLYWPDVTPGGWTPDAWAAP